MSVETSVEQYDFGPTSNDLLESPVAEHNSATPNYQIVTQSAEDIQPVSSA